MTKPTAYWKNKWKAREQPVNNFAKRALLHIKKRGFKTLLDLGSGSGTDAVYFAKHGLKVTALDFSKSGMEKLENQESKVQRIVKDLRDYNYKPNSFDVIYAHLSLHYFDNKTTQSIFKNIYKALKPNGLVFIKCKSTSDPLFGKGKKVGPDMYKKGHTRHFFSKEFMAHNLANFKILSIKKTNSIYHNYKSSFIETVATKK